MALYANSSFEDAESRDALIERGWKIISENWSRAGYNFIPLVTEKMYLRCSLDILLLRPEDDHRIILQGGDIDGRVKTIFDAVRTPKTKEETGNQLPEDGENPFYCLLEDDSLISEVKVTTGQLLLLPSERAVTPHDVFAVIDAKLQLERKTQWSWFFE